MGTAVIKLDQICKSYGEVHAVRDLSLSVPPQSVYGFLGPNGAGKTTTIRLLLALLQPDRGGIELFGRSLQQERIAILRRVGSLVDAPSLYSHLTGRENLEAHRRLLALQKSSIDNALNTVNLASVADRLVTHYSHGMRQRLGMALALLGDPELLILDEPLNGLDPEGIHEIRALIRDLPQMRGVTVFLSSHLLAEVEHVGTHIRILSQGRMQFEGTAADLRTRAKSIVVEVDQRDKACAIIERAGCNVRYQDQRLYVEMQPSVGPAQINAMLVQQHIEVSHLSVQGTTLEEVFLELTRGLGQGSEVLQ
jgi:ABC-2 type transport system ATP-binding protein